MKKITEKALENVAGGKDSRNAEIPKELATNDYLYGYDPDQFGPNPPLTKPEEPERNFDRK